MTDRAEVLRLVSLYARALRDARFWADHAEGSIQHGLDSAELQGVWLSRSMESCSRADGFRQQLVEILPASKGVVGGRVSGATPVPGDATVSPGENSIQPCETTSRNARRPVDRSSGPGELENARETESRGDVGRVPLGRAHNPSPRGPRLLDDQEQYESPPEIPDVRL